MQKIKWKQVYTFKERLQHLDTRNNIVKTYRAYIEEIKYNGLKLNLKIKRNTLKLAKEMYK